MPFGKPFNENEMIFVLLEAVVLLFWALDIAPYGSYKGMTCNKDPQLELKKEHWKPLAEWLRPIRYDHKWIHVGDSHNRCELDHGCPVLVDAVSRNPL